MPAVRHIAEDLLTSLPRFFCCDGTHLTKHYLSTPK
jgi:hypothetical protein